MVSATPLVHHEVPVDGRAVPGHHDGAVGAQLQAHVESQRPLHREGVGPVRRWPGLLDQVPGHEHVGVGHADHEVAGGVRPAGVHQLQDPVAEVDHGGGGEGPVRQDHRAGVDLAGHRLLAVVRRAVGGPPSQLVHARLVGVDGQRLAEGLAERRGAEHVVVVGVRRDNADHLAGAERPRGLDELTADAGGDVRVDDDQPPLPADDGRADVEPGVPGHPDAVGDLGEGGGGGAHGCPA